jgi:hypothetical protein
MDREVGAIYENNGEVGHVDGDDEYVGDAGDTPVVSRGDGFWRGGQPGTTMGGGFGVGPSCSEEQGNG